MFAVPASIDRSRTFRTTIGPTRIWLPVAFWFTVRTAPVWRVGAPFDQIARGPLACSEREREVGNAIGMVHGESPLVSPWRERGERLRATHKVKKPGLRATAHRVALTGGELRLAGNEPGLAPRDTKTPLPPSFRKCERF